MMLVRLMYASRAVPSIDHDELHSILRQSKHNNPQHGITGLLCFSGGIFIQTQGGVPKTVWPFDLAPAKLVWPRPR